MAAVPFHLYPGRSELLQRGPEIASAVLRRAGRDGKDWSKRLDLDACLAMVTALAEQEEVSGLRASVVSGSHLFVYSIGAFWFAPNTPQVIEQFFMRIARGPLAGALADIEALGRDAGAAGVVMATSLAANDEALGRLLGRHGYSPQSSQHFKEL